MSQPVWRIWIVAFLLLLGASPLAAQTVPLGKPSPNAQGQIVVNVNTAIAALPANPACPSSPIAGTGPYQVSFQASPDHTVQEHGTAKVTGYELVLAVPSPTQPCYTATVQAVGPGGTAAATASAPFVLRPGSPAAPGSSAVVSRQ